MNIDQILHEVLRFQTTNIKLKNKISQLTKYTYENNIEKINKCDFLKKKITWDIFKNNKNMLKTVVLFKSKHKKYDDNTPILIF